MLNSNQVIKYYDFWVGIPNSHPTDWSYQAWKIAAFSPEMALYSKILLHEGLRPKRTRKFKMQSDNAFLLTFAKMSIRKIVEYKLTHTSGKTQYRFKKIEEYRITDNLTIV